jgi:glycopeptide antibiotics resistance protein
MVANDVQAEHATNGGDRVSGAAAIDRPSTPGLAKATNVIAKAALVVLLVLALLYPEQGNLRDKAAGLRAVGYPLVAFTVPLLWWALWRDRMSFPWVPDLLITLTCFTDIMGNRMDLYDTVVWFDDWMHFINTGLLAVALILLTLPPRSGRLRTVERALAFGATSAVAWELAEYFAFISRSSERHFAYGDTLGDLTLGTLGAVVGGMAVHRLRQQGRLLDPPAVLPRERVVA